MSSTGPDEQQPADSLGEPEHDRSGPTHDDYVAKAEQGTAAEGDHTPSGEAESGESRVEQMPEVEEVYPDGERPPEAGKAGQP